MSARCRTVNTDTHSHTKQKGTKGDWTTSPSLLFFFFLGLLYLLLSVDPHFPFSPCFTFTFTFTFTTPHLPPHSHTALSFFPSTPFSFIHTLCLERESSLFIRFLSLSLSFHSFLTPPANRVYSHYDGNKGNRVRHGTQHPGIAGHDTQPTRP